MTHNCVSKTFLQMVDLMFNTSTQSIKSQQNLSLFEIHTFQRLTISMISKNALWQSSLFRQLVPFMKNQSSLTLFSLTSHFLWGQQVRLSFSAHSVSSIHLLSIPGYPCKQKRRYDLLSHIHSAVGSSFLWLCHPSILLYLLSPLYTLSSFSSVSSGISPN